jgi:hypothetical protein
MRVDSCLRRPSSKQRQSSKLHAVMHNLIRVEEQKVVDGRLHRSRRGHSLLDGATTLKWFRFLKKFKIRGYTFVV